MFDDICLLIFTIEHKKLTVSSVYTGEVCPRWVSLQDCLAGPFSHGPTNWISETQNEQKNVNTWNNCEILTAYQVKKDVSQHHENCVLQLQNINCKLTIKITLNLPLVQNYKESLLKQVKEEITMEITKYLELNNNKNTTD